MVITLRVTAVVLLVLLIASVLVWWFVLEVGACLDDLRQPRTLNRSLQCSSDVAQPLAPQPDLPTCTSTTWPEPAHS